MNPPATRIEIIMDNRVRCSKQPPEIRQVRDEEPRDDEDLAAFTTADLPAVWIWEEDEQVLVDRHRALRLHDGDRRGVFVYL